MTEDQIERKVQRMVDHLDRVFMAGAMSQGDYDKSMADLNQWAERQYAWAEAEARARRRA